MVKSILEKIKAMVEVRHEIKEMGRDIIVCCCDWKFKLQDAELFGFNVSKDKLLDAYNIHRQVGR